jgi:hypothetical protein
MFENARFLRTCIQSLQKIALFLKFFLLKKSIWVSKLQNFVTISTLLMPA